MHSINADPARRYSVDTLEIQWAPSPSGSVWRKRLYLAGEAESGIVTSVVRYDPRSEFHAHDHPQGEEILVLDGTFSDEHGDWPAGTFLLHPEGFRHAPYSRDGCLLFVRLRQYAGAQRRYVSVDTTRLPWTSTGFPGLSRKTLYAQEGYPDTACIERWDATTEPVTRIYPEGAELFVLKGSFTDESGTCRRHHWLRLPAGAEHSVSTRAGFEVFVRTGLGHPAD